jgi:DNA mismatch endonuclease (patch repair protein)
MTDIMSKEKRSALMAKVRCKDTDVEKALLRLIKKEKIRGASYQLKMFGKPDITFRRKRIAIFCDGDFWHGRAFSSWEKKLTLFWKKKISRNIKRDKEVNKVLRREGWTVLRFWRKQILKKPEWTLKKIKVALSDSR